MQYVGAGKVLFHATDETWRWRYRVGDVYFARYWVQTIRYLCRSKLADASRVAVAVDRSPRIPARRVGAAAGAIRRRAAGPGRGRRRDGGRRAPGPADPADHARAQRPAGLFEGVLEKPAIGSYHAWVATPTLEGQAPAVDFTVAPPAGEFERVRMDAAALRRAAEVTKGRFYTFDTAEHLLGDLPPGRQVPIESLPPRPLWNQLAGAAVVSHPVDRRMGGPKGERNGVERVRD